MDSRKWKRQLARVSPSTVALLVAAVLVAVGSVALVVREPVAPESSGASFTPEPEKERPVVVALGDSYTGGSDMNQGSTWAEQVANRSGWIYYDEAVGGTGYINAPPGDKPYPVRAKAITRNYDQPDAVIVEGGDNDLGHSTAEIAAAMDGTLSTLREGFPRTQLVVVSLFAPDGISPDMAALRDAQREVAHRYDAAFIDVTGLFLGDDADLIGSDGIHPTDAGHRHIAEAVQPQLDRIVGQ